MEPITSVAKFIREKDDFVIVCHYDADGLSAGALAALGLEHLGKEYGIFPTRQIDDERVEKIKDKGRNFLFVDLGSGQLSVLEKNFNSFAVIDHHETLERTVHPHFNAHLVGWDGAKEISGAGCVYEVFKKILPQFVEFSPLAIVGALGDMQDSTGKLIGRNKEIVEEGIKAGVLEVKRDIRLFGRHSRPLVQFLAYSSEPIFPGLTGNEEECKNFLTEIGISWRDNGPIYYVDLTHAQKKRLVTALYIYGKKHFLPEHLLRTLVGEVYELSREKPKTPLKDAREFSTLLNACGRHEEGEIGIKVCMGDRGEYYHKAELLLQRHRRLLREGIEFAVKKGLEETQYLFVLDAGKHVKDTLIGVIAGMLYGAQLATEDKPIIAFALDDSGMLKASGRATWLLVRRGVHLGKAMREAAERVGGTGGGHNIAAGARIKPEDREEFLEALDELIGRQLS